MSDLELIEVIEHIEKILPQFKGKDKDPLKRLVKIERERLKDAAATLGREWIGTFSDAHVEVIARAYQEVLRRIVVRARQPMSNSRGGGG